MVEAVRNGPPPSSAAKTVQETQARHPILNGRPENGLPIGLYSVVFDQFKDDLNHTEDQTTMEEYAKVATLFNASKALYANGKFAQEPSAMRLLRS